MTIENSKSLDIDPKSTCQEIEKLIREKLDFLQRDGAVVALSGGLDSAVAATLAIRALGKERVHLLNMPERDSKPIHRKHAKQFANHLGIKLTTKRISPILRTAGSYKLLPLRFLPTRQLRSALVDFAKSKIIKNKSNKLLAYRLHPEANSWLAKGNAYAIAKHRTRMVIVYQFAEVRNLLVIGAANRTEWMTGTFSKWGVDHCADVMPVLHLYRSQLEEVAEFLQLPDYIRNKAADPDLMPGVNDKGALMGEFTAVDQILYYIENQLDLDTIRQTLGTETVDRVLELVELSRHMRESPYHFLTKL
ncbi:MAG: NAD(+) synthase [Anaerolineales bacterium]|nr:NAD(+) synthase [Anaerolineales bacterium]